jgi:salicylate hydroxylase
MTNSGGRLPHADSASRRCPLLFRQEALELDYTVCLRSVFLRERATSLPDGVVKFGESLEGCD